MILNKRLYLVATLLVLSLVPQALIAQEEGADTAAKIASAMSAAPDAITATATIADLNGDVLRAGTSGFTCMPDDPAIPGDAPVCLDAGWKAFIDAWMNREEPPALENPAFIYALQGGWPTSNVDPYAEGPTEDNEWLGISAPHIAVLVPDVAMLEGVSTDPDNGGPWIMWRDTPYVHLMIPAARKQ